MQVARQLYRAVVPYYSRMRECGPKAAKRTLSLTSVGVAGMRCQHTKTRDTGQNGLTSASYC